MPFANENDVRKEGFLDDFQEVSSERIRKSLAKAHFEILTSTILTDEIEAASGVIRAESLLALSHLFHSLAISSALYADELRAGGARLDGGARMRNLMQLAQELNEEAWGLLRPYVKISPPIGLSLVEGEES
ncbi:MAG: hypothetical protein AB1656_01175 [Candidatus Omnitrophota bacterium]